MKTLKNICRCPDCQSMDESCVDHQVLREEAIKWIKELEEQPLYYAVGTKNHNLICWIKHFFNITDADALVSGDEQ